MRSAVVDLRPVLTTRHSRSVYDHYSFQMMIYYRIRRTHGPYCGQIGFIYCNNRTSKKFNNDYLSLDIILILIQIKYKNSVTYLYVIIVLRKLTILYQLCSLLLLLFVINCILYSCIISLHTIGLHALKFVFFLFITFYITFYYDIV